MNITIPDKVRILAVDDEEIILDIYTEALISCNEISEKEVKMKELAAKLFGHSEEKVRFPFFEVVICSQGDAAVELVKQSLEENNPFAVVFLDVRMPPGPDGVWTGKMIRSLDPEIEIVIVTAYSDISPADIAKQILPLHKLLYVQKPFSPQEIIHFATSLSVKWYMEKESRKIREHLDGRIKVLTEELDKAKKLVELS